MSIIIPEHKKEIRREKLGKLALDLLKNRDEKQSVIETQREMQKNYVNDLIECAKRGENEHGTDFPFYICVQTRRERLFTNVIRNQFYSRKTRPIPQYDLALYWYDPKDERIEFVWCIPDKESVNNILRDFKNGTLPSDQLKLYEFCKSFKENTLV